MSDMEEVVDGAVSGDETPSPEKHKTNMWGAGEIIEGKRAKKTVERLDMQVPKKADKLSIGEGSGEKLGDIPRIGFQLNKMKPDDLVPLHTLLFDRRGKVSTIKKNIRLFSGFCFDADGDQFSRKRDKLQKNTKTKLHLMCSVLDLEKKGSHSELVEKILTFLMSPKSSGKRLPKKKKRSKKNLSGDDGISKKKPSKKRRSSSSKQKPSSTSSPKKSKAIVMDSSSDDDEEEEDKAESEESESGDEPERRSGEVQLSEEPSEEEEDEEEEEEESPKPKARGKFKKTPAKKTKTLSKKPAKKRSRKEATESESDSGDKDEDEEPKKKKTKPAAKTKKADSSSNSKTTNNSNNSTADDSSDEDEPLSKMVKKAPSDEQLKDTVKALLKEANLEELTMKQICQKVFDTFPGHDLSSKKDFIKQTVKSLIT